MGALDVTLPDPTTTINGLPVAARFHDFYSYPMALLDYWQDNLVPNPLPEALYGDYDSVAGTGTLDVLIMTQSSGQTRS